MDKFATALATTTKHVRRSGWLAWASVAVMTLAFLVSSIFLFLAYASNLFLQSVEQEPQIYAFFEVGTDENEITRLQRQWEGLSGVAFIEYTSEDQARQEFFEAQSGINDIAASAVQERNLPASLAIRLDSLDFADEVSEVVFEEKEVNPNINNVLFSRDIVENIREVFTWLRIYGGIIMGLLLIVIVLFTLLTVEFRTHSRSEEIEIMQLVGGSLGYIRLPFVLEGAFYGVAGAFISNLILTGMVILINYQINSGGLDYVRELAGGFNWPGIGVAELAILFAATLVVGFVLGAFNSFLAILRYIK